RRGTEPSSRRSPGCRTAFRWRAPFTNSPLRESRSSTTNPPSADWSRAWRRETEASERLSAQSASRPSSNAPPVWRSTKRRTSRPATTRRIGIMGRASPDSRSTSGVWRERRESEDTSGLASPPSYTQRPSSRSRALTRRSSAGRLRRENHLAAPRVGVETNDVAGLRREERRLGRRETTAGDDVGLGGHDPGLATHDLAAPER